VTSYPNVAASQPAHSGPAPTSARDWIPPVVGVDPDVILAKFLTQAAGQRSSPHVCDDVISTLCELDAMKQASAALQIALRLRIPITKETANVYLRRIPTHPKHVGAAFTLTKYCLGTYCIRAFNGSPFLSQYV
jgi:hypothetical protein